MVFEGAAPFRAAAGMPLHIAANGVLAAGLNIASYLVLQETSAVTKAVSRNLRVDAFFAEVKGGGADTSSKKKLGKSPLQEWIQHRSWIDESASTEHHQAVSVMQLSGSTTTIPADGHYITGGSKGKAKAGKAKKWNYEGVAQWVRSQTRQVNQGRQRTEL